MRSPGQGSCRSTRAFFKGCPVPHAATPRRTYHGGDQVIFVGEVLRLRYDPQGQPLLFYRGKYQGRGAERLSLVLSPRCALCGRRAAMTVIDTDTSRSPVRTGLCCAGRDTSDCANGSPGQVFDRQISPPKPLDRHTMYPVIVFIVISFQLY